MKFPSTFEEYRNFVNRLELATPQSWCSTEDGFRRDAVHLILLLDFWKSIESSNSSSFTPEKTKRLRQWAEAHESRKLSRTVPLVERMLEKGVSPEEISELVQIKQEEMAANICYCIHDPGAPSQIINDIPARMYLLDEKGNPDGLVNALDEMFWAARPKSHEQSD